MQHVISSSDFLVITFIRQKRLKLFGVYAGIIHGILANGRPKYPTVYSNFAIIIAAVVHRVGAGATILIYSTVISKFLSASRAGAQSNRVVKV